MLQIWRIEGKLKGIEGKLKENIAKTLRIKHKHRKNQTFWNLMHLIHCRKCLKHILSTKNMLDVIKIILPGHYLH